MPSPRRWMLHGAEVCEGDEVAMAYDTTTGVAHCIGLRPSIEAWVEAVEERLRENQMTHLALYGSLGIVAFKATEESMQAAGDCWDRTGSALAFARDFGQAEAAAPSMRH